MGGTDATPGRRLYLISGVMQLDQNIDVLPGVLLASSEDEACGSHVKWMKQQHPSSSIHSVWAQVLPDDLVLQAAEIINGVQ